MWWKHVEDEVYFVNTAKLVDGTITLDDLIMNALFFCFHFTLEFCPSYEALSLHPVMQR